MVAIARGFSKGLDIASTDASTDPVTAAAGADGDDSEAKRLELEARRSLHDIVVADELRALREFRSAVIDGRTEAARKRLAELAKTPAAIDGEGVVAQVRSLSP